jgi:hypothetical protein
MKATPFPSMDRKRNKGNYKYMFFSGTIDPSGSGPLMVEASRSHSDTPPGGTPLEE